MEPPDGDVMLKTGLLPRSQEHIVKVAEKIMELSVLSDVPLLQNGGEIVGSTANRQLYILTRNDDWPVSVRWCVCHKHEEHLQAVGEQGVAKTLVEEDARTVPKDRGLRCLRRTCSGQRWRLSENEPSVAAQW